jgi:hypothetical protein
MSRNDELIGITQAAKEYKISARTLRKAATEGILKAKKLAGVWLVSRAEMERYIKNDRKSVGRPAYTKG